MKIGIIGAMDTEIEELVSSLKNKKKETYGQMDFCEGDLYDVPVVISKCGVGKVAAACCVQALRDRYGVTHIINTGAAGSLDYSMDIGDMVISEDAMYHDYDVTLFGYAKGQAAGTDFIAFPADKLLRYYAFSASEEMHPGHTRLGRIASGDQFVCRQEMKDRIIKDTNAICAEMEGAAIAHACWRNGIPFVIVRTVSDKADESASMVYLEDTAARQCAQVTRHIIQRIAEEKGLEYWK